MSIRNNTMENKKKSSSSSTPSTIDIIDLTKETPRACRSTQRRKRICRRPLSPITLGNCDPIDTSVLQICNVTSANETKRKKTVVDDIPEYVESNTNKSSIGLSCPICLEVLSSDLQPTTTRCGHIFCAGCLKMCLDEKTKQPCPTCKKPITAKTCIRLYL